MQSQNQVPIFKDQTILNDSISNIKFHPSLSAYACSCWDGKLILIESQINGANVMTKQSACVQRNSPVLSVNWKTDGSCMLISHADSSIAMVTLGQGSPQVQNISSCPSPILSTSYGVSGHYFTGHQDGAVHLWDLRSDKPVMSLRTPCKVWTMDANNDGNTIITAGNSITPFLFDLRNPNNHIQREWNNKKGFIVNTRFGTDARCYYSTTDGTVCVQYFNTADSYVFRCCKIEPMQHHIEKICLHAPTNNVLTAGSDSSVVLWDIGRKDICTTFQTGAHTKPSVSAADIHPNGSLLAFSTGYNWNMGSYNKLSTYKPDSQLGIYTCVITNEMAQAKPKH